MFRILFSVFLLFCILSDGSGQQTSGRKFILPEEERDDAVRVSVDSSNILREDFSGKERFRRISPDSFAGAIGMPSKNIRWTPARDQDNLNLMLLRETVQSFDNSVILFSEITGAKDGPFGTRLIFIDTVNLLVLKIVELPFIVENVRCQGSSGNIWFYRKAQPDTLKDTTAFCIYNVRKNEFVTELALESIPKRMAPHITGRFAWILEGNDIKKMYPDGKTEAFLTIPGAADIRLSPDCQHIAVITDKETRLYSTENGSLLSRVKMVPDSTFLFLGGESPRLLIGRNQNKISGLDWPETLYMVNKGSARLLFSNLSGSVAADSSGRAFYAVKPKNRIEKRDSTSGQVMNSYLTTSLRPETPGKTVQLFQASEPGHFIIFDTVGGLSKVDATPRRWRKTGMMRPWTE